MTTAVLTIEADAPIAKAAALMLCQQVSSLPVVDGEQVVGIITESDLFKLIAGETALVPHIPARQHKTIMYAIVHLNHTVRHVVTWPKKEV